MVRIRRVGALVVFALVLSACGAAVPPPPSADAPSHCALPAAGADFSAHNPSDAGVDPAAVKRVLDWLGPKATTSLRIYRHRCLIGQTQFDANSKNQEQQFFSMTKTVVSLLVGRAVTLGALDLDDPIAKYLPEADAAHGAITVRELLQQNSGLAFAWANDLLGSLNDSLETMLMLPFAHEPGTFFEYAQTTVTALGVVVERAVGRDLQEFARDDLFRPIGIEDNEWTWARDKAGHTHGYAWLMMTPVAAARLGTLALDHGRWGRKRIITRDYIDEMSVPSSSNQGYGLLTPTNVGEGGYTSFGNNRYEGHRVASAPLDTYFFSGFLDQAIYVVDSLDLVIVRFGVTAPVSWDCEMFRMLMPGVRGAHWTDPGSCPRAPDGVKIEQLIDLPLLIQQIFANQR